MSKIDRYKKKHPDSYKKKIVLPQRGEYYNFDGERGYCVERTPKTATIMTMGGLHVIRGDK